MVGAFGRQTSREAHDAAARSLEMPLCEEARFEVGQKTAVGERLSAVLAQLTLGLESNAKHELVLVLAAASKLVFFFADCTALRDRHQQISSAAVALPATRPLQCLRLSGGGKKAVLSTLAFGDATIVCPAGGEKRTLRQCCLLAKHLGRPAVEQLAALFRHVSSLRVMMESSVDASKLMDVAQNDCIEDARETRKAFDAINCEAVRLVRQSSSPDIHGRVRLLAELSAAALQARVIADEVKLSKSVARHGARRAKINVTICGESYVIQIYHLKVAAWMALLSTRVVSVDLPNEYIDARRYLTRVHDAGNSRKVKAQRMTVWAEANEVRRHRSFLAPPHPPPALCVSVCSPPPLPLPLPPCMIADACSLRVLLSSPLDTGST